MSDLTKLSCQEFLKKLSSNAPTPGGGGGSAMAGALAAALTSMVGNLTVGKHDFAEQEAEVKEILQDLEGLRLQLLNLVNADAEVFNNEGRLRTLPSVFWSILAFFSHCQQHTSTFVLVTR